MTQSPQHFDASLSWKHPRYASPGVKMLNSQLRSYTTSRGTALPEYASFDFRSPSPLRKGAIPKVTLNSQCNVFDCSHSINRKELAAAHESSYQQITAKRRQPRVYYGPCAPGGAYKSAKPDTPPQEIARSVSPGSLRTQTFQIREKRKITQFHDGTLIDRDGEYIWSCCGGGQFTNGCHYRVENLGKTHCESPFRVVH